MPEKNGNSVPYLDENGDLVIPFSCADHRFKYWKQEGLCLADIMAETGMAPEQIARLAPPPKKQDK